MRSVARLICSLLPLLGSFIIEGSLGALRDDRYTIDAMDTHPVTITVITGATAQLPCAVDPRYTEQLADKYKVMWVNPSETAISLQDRRVLNDNRISVERPLIRDWNLHIRNVSLTDTGVYKCQINTDPIATKRVELVVLEPPSIIDATTLSLIERPEGETVELFCNASGTPPPNITWYRMNKINGGPRERVGRTGEALVVHNISRICADTYQCVADNRVEPAAEAKFKIVVHYAPNINLSSSRMGQYLAFDTVLDCTIYAVPFSSVHWLHNGKPIANDIRHDIDIFEENNKVTLSLKMLNIHKEDFGEYTCEASNSQGKSSKKMILYEMFKTPSTTTTTTIKPLDWNSGKGFESSPHLVGDNSQRYNDGATNAHRGNLYQPHVDSQDGALRSHEVPGRTREGSSRYKGVVSSDGPYNTGHQLVASSISVILLSILLPMV